MAAETTFVAGERQNATTGSGNDVPEAKMPRRISAVLGTMSIPDPLGAFNAREALDYFLASGYDEVDTAILYQDGKTEMTLGEIGVDKCRVAAKANPWYKGHDIHDFFTPTDGLRPESVKEQLRISMERLGLSGNQPPALIVLKGDSYRPKDFFRRQSMRVESVDLFYLHAPDHNTPLDDTLQAVEELRAEGRFRRWGLSNYAAWQVVNIWHTCKSRGWQTPSVYQGMYNAMTRDVERELLPALKELGMSFYAYNPLAGGILAGKHSFDKLPDQGRFDGSKVFGAIYIQRYWHKDVFDAIDHVKALCEKNGTNMVSASIRWMYQNSRLSGETGDAVIICGSTVNQVTSNVDACLDKTPLPQEILEAFDQAWKVFKPKCASYFK